MSRTIAAAFTLLVSVLSLIATSIGYLIAGGMTAVLEVTHPGAVEDPVPACPSSLSGQLGALLTFDVCTPLQEKAKLVLLVGVLCVGVLGMTKGRTGQAFGNVGYALGGIVVAGGVLQALASTELLVGTSSVWYNTSIWMEVIQWTLWMILASGVMLLARWAAPDPEPAVRHLPR